MQEMHDTWVQSLGWEDPLQEGMATHPSILAWEIPWTEEPGGLQSMVLQRVGHDWLTKHNSQNSKYIRSEYLTNWIWKRRWKSFSEIFPWLMFRKTGFSFICFKIENLKTWRQTLMKLGNTCLVWVLKTRIKGYGFSFSEIKVCWKCWQQLFFIVIRSVHSIFRHFEWKLSLTEENHVLPNENEQMYKPNLKINLGFTFPCKACENVNASFHRCIETDKGEGEAAADLVFKKIT